MLLEVFMRFYSLFIFLMMTGAVLADPPMKTIYSDSSTTNFSWTWPYHTNQIKTLVQTHPSLAGSGFKTNTYGTWDDVSKYRFHNAHLTYKNQWGYFFPPGTKPVKNNGAVLFVSPHGYFIKSK